MNRSEASQIERTYDDALLLSVVIEEGADLLVDQQRQGKNADVVPSNFFGAGHFKIGKCKAIAKVDGCSR